MLSINGAVVASPSELSVNIEDRGDFSACNVLGQRLADRLAVKRVIDVEWALLSAAEMAAIMHAVSENVFFSVAYPDPDTGAGREAVCRAMERSARVHRMEDGTAMWTDVRMRWEER
ncbi:MAG: hypothetical protein IJC56_11160 [Clostridia bacterium]|nr:hypothetical protein [Clostridia bacterium]